MTEKKEPYGDVEYADPGYQADKKKRYPLDTHEHVKAAWDYINHPDNASKYSSEQLAQIKSKIRAAAKRVGMQIANESANPEAQLFVNIATIDEKGHVQLAPYGDFLNIDCSGRRVIQRFEKSDAEAIVNEFNSLRNTPQRLLGAPWYIGHPDHSRFKDIYKDTRAYGRVKKLEAGDDGLYANVRFGAAGKQLLDDEAFHGHSVNWLAVPNGREKGLQIFRPVSLKSIGFTNEPQIPVLPASLANIESEDGLSLTEEELTNEMIPPKLKILCGFKEDEDVTIEQFIAAMKKCGFSHPSTQISNEKLMQNNKTEKPPIFLVNVKSDGTFEVQLADEGDNNGGISLDDLAKKINSGLSNAAQALANEKKARDDERKGRAALVVDPLVKSGRIVTKDRDAKIEELCNAEDFDAKAKEFSNEKVTVKTAARTGQLAGKHADLSNDVRTRQVKFQALMNKRAQALPNESYEDRFEAVTSSDEGQQLFAQMERPEKSAA